MKLKTLALAMGIAATVGLAGVVQAQMPKVPGMEGAAKDMAVDKAKETAMEKAKDAAMEKAQGTMGTPSSGTATEKATEAATTQGAVTKPVESPATTIKVPGAPTSGTLGGVSANPSEAATGAVKDAAQEKAKKLVP